MTIVQFFNIFTNRPARKHITLVLVCIAMLAVLQCNRADENRQIEDTAGGMYLFISFPFLPGPYVDYSDIEPTQRGRLIGSQRLWDLPIQYIQIFVQQYLASVGRPLSDYPALAPICGATYYYIVYETIDWNGNLVRASGTIWVPKLYSSLPMLAYCHGTQLSSSTDLIRIQNGLFAARGFFTAGPDYLGYGDSAALDHPYCHASTMASSTVDFIRAAKKFAEYNEINLNGKLFVTGISEGGMTAMATVRELEANYATIHPLLAAAPISGPYDLTSTASYYIVPNKTLTGSQLNYMVFITPIYLTIYGTGKTLDYYVKEPYATWFTQDRYPRADGDTISNQIPTNTSDLMTSAFIASYQGAGETDLKAAIALNNTYNFVPKCHIRLYAATGDTHVPPFNADNAYGYFTANGALHASIEKVSGDHGSSAIPLFAKMIEWFSSF